MLLIPAEALKLAAARGLGEREGGDLVLTVCSGEAEADGLEPGVEEEDSSQEERGKRLNHWLRCSISILESWSS